MSTVEQEQARGAHQKYCCDCGKLIFERAEICPNCGCRQLPPAQPSAGPVILLIVLNILWTGLGNLVIGDKRGWAYGFLNWLVLLASILTFGLASIAFFAYCSYQGYEYLRKTAGR